MTGLDKITNQIIEEANSSASEILQKAEAEAEKLREEALEEAKIECEKINRKSVSEIANYKDRMNSSADLKRRTAILNMKQSMISVTLEKAYHTFCNQEATQYFQTIKEMLKKFVLPQNGEIFFSDADMAKMPKEFVNEISAIAKEKGGTLTLSQDRRNVEKGFILAYGGIEENCSFEALFNSKKDELQDEVQKILFS
ncbi:MAG: V-type ATP synthase subunit E family protein [Lachnospiraceae bacterium]